MLAYRVLVRPQLAVVLSVLTVILVTFDISARFGEPSGGHPSAGIEGDILNLDTLP